MRRNLFAARLLCAATALCLALVCAPPAQARETILVSGNPDLYPIESYDHDAGCYTGLLPELYERLSGCTEYDFVYLPYSARTSQEQQAENKQADIISACVEGSVSNALLISRVPVCTQEIDGQEREVSVAFTGAVSETAASEIAQALKAIPKTEQLGILSEYAHAHDAGSYRTRWLITLAALIAIVLAAALALVAFARKKRAELRSSAMIDPRFGIGNDRFFVHCMETEIPAPLRSLYYVVCIGCDKDLLERRFSESEREELLRYAAEFLGRGCGREDYLSYVSRGTFALICQRGSREAAWQHIETLVKTLNAYLAGFRSEYDGLFCAGICALDENPGCDARAALYNARQGRAYAMRNGMSCAFSTKRMVEESGQIERLHRRLSDALAKEEFVPYLQFITDRSGTVVGAEMLSRWQNPEEGLLTPSKYIELMIRSGAIMEHDLYIFRCACEQLQTWGRESGRHLSLSCNFTRFSISDASCLERMREIAARYEFEHDRMLIEITEDSLACSRSTAQETICGLSALGFRILLDDMGAGYSSLSDLCTYPIDRVKIERELMLHAAEERGRKLLAGLVQLSHSMGIQVLCEGVETQEQLDIVLAAGCDYIQGFYFSRVLPKREAERYLRELAGQ